MTPLISVAELEALGRNFEVKILSTDGPNGIWVRPISLQSRYSKMLQILYTFYEELDQRTRISRTDLREGMLVGVRSFGVHRAAIREISDDDDTVEIWYIDDGCSGQVQWQDLIHLDEAFKKLPRMAIHCGLAGVSAIERMWSEASDLLREVTFGQNGTMLVSRIVKEDSSLRVSLWVNQENLGQLLVEKGYACEGKYSWLRPGF